MLSFDIVSDLHLDIGRKETSDRFLQGLKAKSSSLIIAGDLCEFHNLEDSWVSIIAEKWENVYYVPGNHDYWGLEMGKEIPEIPEWNTLIRDTITTEEGIVIAGATGWFPYKGTNIYYEPYMNDFANILCDREQYYEEYEADKEFFQNANADVWIMHHLPFELSIAERYQKSIINCFFYSEYEGMFHSLSTPPKLIVHGHTHIPTLYTYNTTTVACNPRGYPGENSGIYKVGTIEV